jgi:hypothetical protein
MRYLGAGDIVNVFHADMIGVDDGDEQGVFDAIAGHLNQAYSILVSSLPDVVTFADITMQNLSQNILMGSASWPSLTVGSGATDAMPPQIANLVVFPTLIPRSQGRKYLPCFTEALYVDGAITAGGISLLNQWGLEFVGQQDTTFHSFQFGNYSESPAHFYSWTSRKVIPAARTQRRRTIGFGS